MPKDTKKEVKKVFPLTTTAQSDAYKQQLKVSLFLFRDKGMSFIQVLKSSCNKLLSKRPFHHTLTYTGKIIMVLVKLISLMSLKSTSIVMTRKLREIDILTSKRKHRQKRPMNFP
jgi:hypothetical protein